LIKDRLGVSLDYRVEGNAMGGHYLARVMPDNYIRFTSNPDVKSIEMI